MPDRANAEEGDGPDAAEWRALNRANWDERVPIHLDSPLYDLESFVAGAETLYRFELGELGPLEGRRAVHLQCHIGTDTISLARHGATVTGLDFSEPAVEAARALAARVGVEAEFVHADVYDAPRALGRRFELVYTGRGALNWLPDLVGWAEVVASLLEPGGMLYLVEFHPLQWIFADDTLEVAYSYFNTEPFVLDDPNDYADPEARLRHSLTVEWSHPLSEVVTALLRAGLVIESLAEYPDCEFRRFSFLVEREPGRFSMPEGAPQLPFVYSLRARRPA